MRKNHLPFWIITVAYGAGFMLPTLISEGTFLDGQIYAVLARNLAAGQGSFWAPHYTAASHPEWFDHPPLGLNIASVFYRILGEGLWVDHLYSLFTFLVCAWLVVALWKQAVGADDKLRRLGWLPVLLWVMNPQVTWAYSNNMLENTMTIFSLAAVFFLVRSCQVQKNWLPYLGLGVLAMVAAGLTKGIVGCYPLVTLVAWQLGTGRLGWSRAILRSALLVFLTGGLFLLLWLIPSSHYNLSNYFNTMWMPSMAGKRTQTGNHFMFLVKLFNTLLPSLAVVIIALVFSWRGRVLSFFKSRHRGAALTFLLLGLAGSVPLTVSPRQSMFYVLPSFPCFALAIGCWVGPALSELVERIGDRPPVLWAWRVMAMLLLVTSLAVGFSRLGTYNRNPEMLHDVKVIGEFLQRGNSPSSSQEVIVGSCRNLWRQWGLYCHLARYNRIAMSPNDSTMNYAIGVDGCAEDLEAQYEPVELDTKKYRLFSRRDEAGVKGLE